MKSTTRPCIDRLRLARRREEYVGRWLPEPISGGWSGAVYRPELAESPSMAFLVLGPGGILYRISRSPNPKSRTRVLAVILHPRDAKEMTVPAPDE